MHRVYLYSLVIENFKSFKGKTEIYPLQSLVAIIGPNGSGKSNLLEAIAFVFGDKVANLRAQRLEELMHGLKIGSNSHAASSCYVAAVLKNENLGTSKEFKRVVRASPVKTTYYVDNVVVTATNYAEQLKEFGINMSAKNVVVYQGTVESIAMKEPKDRVEMFEIISGSAELKREYDRLKEAVQNSEEEINQAARVLKNITTDERHMQKENDEAAAFQRVNNEIKALEREEQLFRLYYVDRDIEDCDEQILTVQNDMNELMTTKENIESDVTKEREITAHLHKKLNTKLKKKSQMENNLMSSRPLQITAREDVAQAKIKLAKATTTLEQAHKGKAAHENAINALEKELAHVESQEKAFVEKHTLELQSQRVDIVLQDSQLKEYWAIKQDIRKACDNDLARLKELKEQLQHETEVLNTQAKEKTILQNTIHSIQQEITDTANNNEKTLAVINQLIEKCSSEKALTDEKKADLCKAKETRMRLGEELLQINMELDVGHFHKRELARNTKRAEVVELLKSKFPGVYGRITNLCRPSRERYAIAAAKIMAKFMQAIVVDTKETAKHCVNLLKDRMLYPETFLALDSLKYPAAVELDGQYIPRDFEPVHLLIDLLEFDARYRPAIQFVVQNSIVCPTTDSAKYMAYSYGKGKRYDTVTLEGVQFQRSGVASCGRYDLMRMVGEWSQRKVVELQSRKDEILTQMACALATVNRERDIEIQDDQVLALQNRLKFAKQEAALTNSKIEELQNKLKDTKTELNSMNKLITKAAEKVDQRQAEIDSLNAEIKSIECDKFKKFCKKLRIKNIEAYEQDELRLHNETDAQMKQFLHEKSRIESQLDFEKSRAGSVLENVNRWMKAVKKLMTELDGKTEVAEREAAAVSKLSLEVDQMNESLVDIKKKNDEKRTVLQQLQGKLGETSSKLTERKANISLLSAKKKQKIKDRHSIVKFCKLNGIQILVERQDVTDEDHLYVSSMPLGQDTQSILNDESILEIDYFGLREEFRGLMPPERKLKRQALQKQLAKLIEERQNINIPNFNATSDMLADVCKSAENAKKSLEETKAKTLDLKREFESIQEQRLSRFKECYEYVARHIDLIYKEMNDDNSASASINCINKEEPYLDGITYSCIAPGKRLQGMGNLSGGEKSMAALALLFTLQNYSSSPFLILDEIDGALDRANMIKLSNYLQKREHGFQVIMISHKLELIETANALVGVTCDPNQNAVTETKIFTLDVSEYLH